MTCIIHKKEKESLREGHMDPSQLKNKKVDMFIKYNSKKDLETRKNNFKNYIIILIKHH